MHDFIGKANPKTRFAPLNQVFFFFFFPLSKFRNLANCFSENEKGKPIKITLRDFRHFSK